MLKIRCLACGDYFYRDIGLVEDSVWLCGNCIRTDYVAVTKVLLGYSVAIWPGCYLPFIVFN